MVWNIQASLNIQNMSEFGYSFDGKYGNYRMLIIREYNIFLISNIVVNLSCNSHMRPGFDFEYELIFMLVTMVFEFNSVKLDMLCG